VHLDQWRSLVHRGCYIPPSADLAARAAPMVAEPHAAHQSRFLPVAIHYLDATSTPRNVSSEYVRGPLVVHTGGFTVTERMARTIYVAPLVPVLVPVAC
jgi:hypothetical protein